MSLRHGSRAVLPFLPLALAFLFPDEAHAWKPATHMILAKRAIDRVSDPAVRDPVNLPYVEAGSIGPDLFYFSLLMRYRY